MMNFLRKWFVKDDRIKFITLNAFIVSKEDVTPETEDNVNECMECLKQQAKYRASLGDDIIDCDDICSDISEDSEDTEVSLPLSSMKTKPILVKVDDIKSFAPSADGRLIIEFQESGMVLFSDKFTDFKERAKSVFKIV